MKLILVRHGEAVDQFTNPERPLTEFGENQVRQLADKLRNQDIEIQKVIHSGIKRANQTAQILIENINPNLSIEQGKDLNPESNPNVWKEISLNENTNIMLVGHMPFMGDLASNLSNKMIGFETASAVIFEKVDEEFKLIWQSNN